MKYRVTEKMPANTHGYKAGDVIEYDESLAPRLIAKGYLEPLEMVELKQDKQLRSYRRKEK